MTTNGWGWTRYIDIRWNYSFDDAKKCWLWTNWSWTIECFNPNRLNFVVSEYMVKQDTDWDVNHSMDKYWTKKFKKSYPSQIEEWVTTDLRYYIKWCLKYMIAIAENEKPNKKLDNINWVYLGLW